MSISKLNAALTSLFYGISPLLLVCTVDTLQIKNSRSFSIQVCVCVCVCVCEKGCVAKMCAKTGVSKMCIEDVVCSRRCVTKMCVKEGVTKMCVNDGV